MARLKPCPDPKLSIAASQLLFMTIFHFARDGSFDRLSILQRARFARYKFFDLVVILKGLGIVGGSKVVFRWNLELWSVFCLT